MAWFMLLVAAAGAAVGLQVGVNARLGRELGHPVLAGLVSFLVGTAGILLYLALARPPLPTAVVLQRIPSWAWTGGLLGAFYVVVAIIAPPRLGIAVTLGLVVAGQMGMSLVLDHFGWLGVERQPISAGRLLGAALIAAGVVLLRRM